MNPNSRWAQWGFGKTLKCFKDFTRKSVQYDLDPTFDSADTRDNYLLNNNGGLRAIVSVLYVNIMALSLGSSYCTDYMGKLACHWFMQEHKLVDLNKIIEERIRSLREEVEIATNVKLNPLYIIELKDEIVSLRWTTRIIRWILDRAIDGQQQLGVTKKRLELEDTKKFENMLDEKIQELEIELEDSNTDREEEILVKEIGTLKCVLGHLFNLKPGGDETRVTGIVQADNNYQQAIRLGNNQSRSRIDIEPEISTQIQT